MKCDSGQDGCQPCQSKNFRCVATDRITGHTYERGEAARLKKEVEELRAQVDAYRQHLELQNSAQYPVSGAYQGYAPLNGYDGNPPQSQQMPMTNQQVDAVSTICDDSDGPHRGPIHETIIDFIDGEIDIAAFDCPDMAETMRIPQATLLLNNSRQSSLATILGAQKPEKPQMPPREEALQWIDNHLSLIAPYIPIVHGPTFRKQVADYYDHPTTFDEKPAETVMIMVVLAIFAYQMAIRNPPMREEKLAESNRLYHYSLSFYSELLLGDSLANMQALAFFLVHARNLPKPGNSWSLSSMILGRAIELNYHRSSSKIVLPPEQQNVLAIELRKRVFWSILGIQVTIAVKMGRPMAISPKDMDVELPHAALDSEITEHGIVFRSGKCDFWAHIFLCKMLPILINLYNNIIRVRKPWVEYCREVDELDSQLTQWRHDWDRATANQTRNGTYKIATHLIDVWYSETRIILHHPRLCTSQATDVQEKNLDICLEASGTMLRNLMSLRDFRAADFTWHFISGYVLGMGMAMHVYNRRKERLNAEALRRMGHELRNWLSVMKSADRFTRSGDYLFKFFQPRVQQCLEHVQTLMTASEALRNGYHHGPTSQLQHTDGAQARAQSQVEHTYPAAESYQQHPATYPDNLVTNTMPKPAAPPAKQHNSYNTQPPPSSTSNASTSTSNASISITSAPQQPQQYASDSPDENNPYQISLPQSSSSDTITTPANHTPVPFIPDQGPATYSAFPPPSASLYVAGAGMSSYPSAATSLTGHDHDHDGFSPDVYSMAQVIWPTNIVQYQNSGM